MAQVELGQVSKIYPGGVRAVDGVDLSIADREFVVLVGPSGCGKSTTLRMVAGLEEITSGTIRIGGARGEQGPAQGSGHRDGLSELRALSAHDRLQEHGVRAEAAEDAEGADSSARAGGGEDSGYRGICWIASPRRCRAGSGSGWRWVGRSSASRRRFLFDEPLSNLDAKLRVTTRAELKRLHQRLRTTTIYVTHDQEEAMTLGDRIVVMKDGMIQQADTPLRTYSHPANRFVAGFIGMPPMNFFDGVIKRSRGGWCLKRGRPKVARREVNRP